MGTSLNAIRKTLLDIAPMAKATLDALNNNRVANSRAKLIYRVRHGLSAHPFPLVYHERQGRVVIVVAVSESTHRWLRIYEGVAVLEGGETVEGKASLLAAQGEKEAVRKTE
jgi:hypothetical protein